MASLTVNTRTRKYLDIDLDFIPNPVTGDIVRKVDDDAVIRSVRNLIFTNFYERPFHPEIGSDVRASLFENITPVTLLRIKNAIEQVINNFEPRARLDQVVTQANADGNSVYAYIKFYIQNNVEPTTISVLLERVR